MESKGRKTEWSTVLTDKTTKTQLRKKDCLFVIVKSDGGWIKVDWNFHLSQLTMAGKLDWSERDSVPFDFKALKDSAIKQFRGMIKEQMTPKSKLSEEEYAEVERQNQNRGAFIPALDEECRHDLEWKRAPEEAWLSEQAQCQVGDQDFDEGIDERTGEIINKDIQGSGAKFTKKTKRKEYIAPSTKLEHTLNKHYAVLAQA